MFMQFQFPLLNSKIRSEVKSLPAQSCQIYRTILYNFTWSVKDDLIFKAGKIYIPKNSEMLSKSCN
jgi:hypothetical protein